MITSLVATTATAAVVATKLVIISGTHQTGAEGAVLAQPLVVEVQDANKNPVSGITVQFKPVTKGVVNPASAVTNVEGSAQTYFQLPTVQGTFTDRKSTRLNSSHLGISYA